jgi:hypothetical protein
MNVSGDGASLVLVFMVHCAFDSSLLSIGSRLREIMPGSSGNECIKLIPVLNLHLEKDPLKFKPQTCMLQQPEHVAGLVPNPTEMISHWYSMPFRHLLNDDE